MPVPKALSAREKKALIMVKNTNDWTMTELADTIGVAERTLSRYLQDDVSPRNNQKGIAIYKKIRTLIADVKVPRKESPIIRIHKGVKPGVLLTIEETETIKAYQEKHALSFVRMAEAFGCSSGHLTQVMNREKKISDELRSKILTLISDNPDTVPAPEEKEDLPQQKDYVHQFRLREDYVINLILPDDLTKEEADRLSLFVSTLSL